MNDLLLTLVRPSAGVLPEHVLQRLRGEEEWRVLSHRLSRLGLGALVCERLEPYASEMPRGFLEGLRSERRQTAARNTLLLDVLDEVTGRISARGVPVVVLKGPVLAHLGTGLLVRPFHDLDVLVRPRDLGAAVGALTSAGFAEAPGAAHHRILVRPGPTIAAIAEVHVDLSDPDRRYMPDVRGIWDRSSELDLQGRSVTAPSLTDHLLLAVMQLPHHRWEPRLVVDIATVVDRWKDRIEWDAFMRRAGDWGLRALAGSTLDAIGSMLEVPLPDTTWGFSKADSYPRVVQWQVVRRAIREQFAGARSGIGAIAPLVVLDRLPDIASLLARRIAFNGNWGDADRAVPRYLRRIMVGATALPAALQVLGHGIGAARIKRSLALDKRKKAGP